VHVLIVDDERVARDRVRRFLQAEPDVAIVGECATGREAIAAIERERPDVVFLDVQLGDVDAFEVVRAGREAPPVIVFVTAYDEYALKAFDVHAADYLLKPFDARRFRLAVERVRERLGAGGESEAARMRALLADLLHRPDGQEERPGFPERLAVPSAGRLYLIRVRDIDWIEAARNYVRIHVGGETHLLRRSLGDLMTLLDPREFARIHRSTIVNINRIREMQPWFSGDYVVILRSGTKLKLTRNYRGVLDVIGAPGSRGAAAARRDDAE
jgi:two-component system, LytTR family, response regulator